MQLTIAQNTKINKQTKKQVERNNRLRLQSATPKCVKANQGHPVHQKHMKNIRYA